ncbi:MAG: hypothetical protein Ct9H300mP11_13800 [Chloroflexota bacterium]|nr:MAG: hypothetical protein Ct9H300mP11_13800 [Chloroflexota bacterium]
MALPTEDDFSGPLVEDIDRYLETDFSSAKERSSCSAWLGILAAVPSAQGRFCMRGSFKEIGTAT